jgi:copper(I)-binding protein
MKNQRIMPLVGKLIVVAALAFGGTASAQNAGVGSLEVRDAWVRESVGPAKTAAGYLELHNGGTEPVSITGASSGAAMRLELHTTIRDGDVMRMRPLTTIDVAPGETVALEPGGKHIMFMGVKETLRVGNRVDLTLTLSDGRTVAVTAPVKSLQAGRGHRHGDKMKSNDGAEKHKHGN